MDKQIKPALLTRTEIEWLLGKKEVSKSYEYKMKSVISKKMNTLAELELPLLKKKGLIGDGLDLTVYGKNLTANGKVGTAASVNSLGNLDMGAVGFEPTTTCV